MRPRDQLDHADGYNQERWRRIRLAASARNLQPILSCRL